MSDQSSKRPRGTCPVCGRSIMLRGNGELRDHQGRSTDVQTVKGERCLGSGMVAEGRRS